MTWQTTQLNKVNNANTQQQHNKWHINISTDYIYHMCTFASLWVVKKTKTFPLQRTLILEKCCLQLISRRKICDFHSLYSFWYIHQHNSCFAIKHTRYALLSGRALFELNVCMKYRPADDLRWIKESSIKLSFCGA